MEDEDANIGGGRPEDPIPDGEEIVDCDCGRSGDEIENDVAEAGGENDALPVEIFRAPRALVEASGDGEVNRGRGVPGRECDCCCWKPLALSGGAVGIACVITCGDRVADPI